MWLLYIFLFGAIAAAQQNETEKDGEESRKILGSSVVTSVSVVMDTGNGKKTVYTDAIGKPHSKPSNPSDLASPIELLHPDRYEFYTFDDNGDLVKRLMSLDEIKSIIATGDSDAFDLDAFTSQGFVPEKRVSDVVSNVQNVLKEEMEILKDPISKPIFDTPDVSDSWSMILPAIFGNSGEDIKPERPISHVTPDTIMIEPNGETHSTPSTQSTSVLTQSTTYKPVYYSSPSILTQKIPTSTEPILKVEIFSNSEQSTERPSNLSSSTSATSTTESEIPTRESVGTTNTKPPLIRTSSVLTTLMPTSPETTISDSSSTVYINFKSSTPMVSSTTPSDFNNKEALDAAPEEILTESTLKPSSTSTTAQTTQKSPAHTSTTVSSSTITLSSSTTPISTTSKQTQATSMKTTSTTERSTESPTTKSVQSTATTPGQLSSSLFTSSVSAVPTNPPSLTTSTVSRLTIKPQLNNTSTITNINQAAPTRLTTVAVVPVKSTQATTSVRPTTVAQPTEKITESSKIVTYSTVTDSNNEATTLVLSNLPLTESLLSKITTTTPSITKIPSLLQSLSNDQKLSASELLDQLLLTTNIYEINTELSSPKITNSDKYLEIGIADNNASSSVTLDDTVIGLTTEQDSYLYPPTTDSTIIQSIEQLLSQAVDNYQEPIDHSAQGEKILQIIENSAQKTMEEVIESAATVSSQLIGEGITESATEIASTTGDNIFDATSVLTNVTDSDFVEATTIIVTDKSSTEATSKKTDIINDTTIASVSFTEKIELSHEANSTEQSAVHNTTVNPPAESSNESVEESTIYYIKSKVPTTTEGQFSHLINITIINYDPARNKTKPAKSDLSLEEKLIAEELKNMSLIRNNATVVTPNLTETIKESETRITFINTSTVSSEDDTTTIAAIETTTNLEEDQISTEKSTEPVSITTTSRRSSTEPSTTTIKSIETTRKPIKPSIVITISENNTVVTENGKLVANKTISPQKSDADKPTATPTTHPQKNPGQNQTWTLVSTVKPHRESSQQTSSSTISYAEAIEPPVPVDLVPKPMQGFGLEESTANLESDVYQFVQLCNELAFGFWRTVTSSLSSARSVFVSPFAATSMLAMVFLGAKGATSEEMNDILKLDDMVTFNPHLIFKNVSESIETGQKSGVATVTLIRELFSDKSKGKLLDFYKNRVRAFYDGYVEEVGYREIGDVIRRRTNLLVKKHTDGKYPEYLKDSSITVRSPLSGVAVNLFETDCSQSSYDGRDGELHFVVLPSIRQRRLIPIPAVVYRTGFLAGYEPSLDATAVSLGNKHQVVSTILVIPGQQGISAPGDGLARLEKRLVESSFKKGAWSRLLRSLIPRPGLEVQIPRFSHKSIINATSTLKKMGLHELFNPDQADLRGLNGISNELHLSDVLQINSFATCGERKVGESHHSEIYPATSHKSRESRYLQDILQDIDQEPRDYQRAFHDPLHNPSFYSLPLSMRPRQARIPEVPRLRFDRPFLYFIRHNPTGLILHMGRFNPRLLP